MIRQKLIALLIISPLIGGLCLAAYKFGPGPAAKTEIPATGQGSTAAAAVPDQTLPAQSKLFELFGMYETAVGKGRVKSTAAEYLDSIEALYLRRGYLKIDSNEMAKLKKRKPGVVRRPEKPTAIKFFQRQETNGISSISATGVDADYTTGREAKQPFSFSTLVTEGEDGNVDWATYRLEVDHSKIGRISKLEEGDFPGTDPTNIPRYPGLQRIYAINSERGALAIYKSSETEISLMIRYLADMPRYGWRLDQEVTSNANHAARGVMCFVRGQRFSLIWITPNPDAKSTNVTISSY